jgi:phosphoglycolate phosphatase
LNRSPSPKKALIFDLDGTLVDTIRDISAAMNSVLERHGMPQHAVDAYRLMVGLGVGQLVAKAIPTHHATPHVISALTAEMMEHYTRYPVVHSEPYAGIPELLAGLRDRRIPTAILSNKPHDLALVTVERLFPEYRFDRVQGDEPAFPRKPNPDAALDICRTLHLSPSDVLFVGDSDVDVQTAHNAGMACAGVAWGFRGEAELRSAGAECIATRPADLLGWIN